MRSANYPVMGGDGIALPGPPAFERAGQSWRFHGLLGSRHEPVGFAEGMRRDASAGQERHRVGGNQRARRQWAPCPITPTEGNDTTVSAPGDPMKGTAVLMGEGLALGSGPQP